MLVDFFVTGIALGGIIKALYSVYSLKKQEKELAQHLSEISLFLENIKKQNEKKSYPPYNIQISEKELKELQDKIIDIIKKNGETDVLDGMEQKDKKGQIAYLNKILQKSKIITKGTFVTTEC